MEALDSSRSDPEATSTSAETGRLPCRPVAFHPFEIAQNGGFFADFCANAPFATGTGTFSYNDNDAAFSGNRDDAFRFQLEGDAASASGQRYHVLAKFKAIVSRGGVERVTSDEVQVSPAGG